MRKTIKVDDDAHALLRSIKSSDRNSHMPLETCGELEDAYTRLSPPKVNLNVLDRVVKERGRRSGGRK